ncbi:GntR family transcriptional regulator [Lentzea sp. NBRC 105346]|uniref:GntR family transcriptional regulator n=1 Tax=Lentzea sp. NBRC 105346 TaxID=3032205 RepID=UPI0024A597B8|nr:GntR family transcriptional regulator [Lentzea sp. NBRC 105346]GLZ36350.1 GntR family transcriptional regulator [Lentzea sp. NBRC 105346]
MQLSPSAGHPYQALAAVVIAQIEQGELQPDDKLPSVRELATEAGVTIATAQRAIAVLGEKGYVTTIPGRGSFVRERPAQEVEELPLAEQVRELRAEVAELRSRVDAVERAEH